MRTTSSIESMHSVFHRQFPKHPNIYDFAENVRQFEYTQTDKIEELVETDGTAPRMQREKDRKRNEKIERFSQQLENRTITFKQFLDEMTKEDDDEDESEFESEYGSEYESEDESKDEDNSIDESE